MFWWVDLIPLKDWLFIFFRLNWIILRWVWVYVSAKHPVHLKMSPLFYNKCVPLAMFICHANKVYDESWTIERNNTKIIVSTTCVLLLKILAIWKVWIEKMCVVRCYLIALLAAFSFGNDMEWFHQLKWLLPFWKEQPINNQPKQEERSVDETFGVDKNVIKSLFFRRFLRHFIKYGKIEYACSMRSNLNLNL